MKKYDGKLIFHQRNQLGDIEVVDGPLLRTLHFGTPVVQSSMYLDDPFALEMEYNRVMMLGLLFNPNPQKALFLGLGGGSKSKFLWKYFTECHVDAVEYNPLVIDVCTRYFDVPRDDRFAIYAEEATVFLSRSLEPQYNFIFIDLYIDSGMSEAVGENDFFEACFNQLKEGGVLVWNLWRSSPKELIESSVGNLAHFFGQDLLILPIQESLNYILMAFKKPTPTDSLKVITHQAEKLTRKTGMDFVKTLSDLNHFQGHGFLFQDWI
jgi:spermidine synthase